MDLYIKVACINISSTCSLCLCSHSLCLDVFICASVPTVISARFSMLESVIDGHPLTAFISMFLDLMLLASTLSACAAISMAFTPLTVALKPPFTCAILSKLELASDSCPMTAIIKSMSLDPVLLASTLSAYAAISLAFTPLTVAFKPPFSCAILSKLELASDSCPMTAIIKSMSLDPVLLASTLSAYAAISLAFTPLTVAFKPPFSCAILSKLELASDAYPLTAIKSMFLDPMLLASTLLAYALITYHQIKSWTGDKCTCRLCI